MVTPQTICTIALALPSAEKAASYGAPSFKVHGKMFARIRDQQTMVVNISQDEREAWRQADPQIFLVPDHYKNYDAMVVDLNKVGENDARTLIENA